jgi:predicted amidohydrolase
VYTAGDDKLIRHLDGRYALCYDLRFFPVFSRNVGKQYDLLLYVASWPKTRIKAWDTC